MDIDTRLRRTEDVLFSEVGGNLLMMSVETGNYHELDDIAGAIWEELEQPVTVGELRDRLCQRFEVAPDQCLADITPFLEQLAEFKLVELQ